MELSINRHSTIIIITTNMSNSINASADDEVFEYTGEGCVVPKNVKIVRFHPSVVEVEKRAFCDCNQLREVVFHDGMQKIGKLAFARCKSLVSITFPSTVTEIEHGAFQKCKQLKGVVLNNGLRKIGGYAFWACISLESIKLPSTVTYIGISAFENCRELREVVLNKELQKIGAGAFDSCRSLSSIVLPSTITEIEHGAFNGCNNLRDPVVFHGIPREVGRYAFLNCTSLERFTFPTISARLDHLIQTGHWEEIENEMDEVRGIVERSGGDLFSSAQTMDWGNNWNRVRESLDNIVRVISCYELKEATSIFELALWKFKLDQVDETNPIPRKKCRMDVPGPAKDIILQYLPYECLLPVPDV